IEQKIRDPGTGDTAFVLDRRARAGERPAGIGLLIGGQNERQKGHRSHDHQPPRLADQRGVPRRKTQIGWHGPAARRHIIPSYNHCLAWCLSRRTLYLGWMGERRPLGSMGMPPTSVRIAPLFAREDNLERSP